MWLDGQKLTAWITSGQIESRQARTRPQINHSVAFSEVIQHHPVGLFFEHFRKRKNVRSNFAEGHVSFDGTAHLQREQFTGNRVSSLIANLVIAEAQY